MCDEKKTLIITRFIKNTRSDTIILFFLFLNTLAGIGYFEEVSKNFLF